MWLAGVSWKGKTRKRRKRLLSIEEGRKQGNVLDFIALTMARLDSTRLWSATARPRLVPREHIACMAWKARGSIGHQ